MSTRDSAPEVPTWLAAVLVAFVGLAAVYVVLLGGPLVAPVTVLLWLFGLGLSLFVVYLLWRFVVAVEKIADKM
jgi:hypothetical protein